MSGQGARPPAPAHCCRLCRPPVQSLTCACQSGLCVTALAPITWRLRRDHTPQEYSRCTYIQQPGVSWLLRFRAGIFVASPLSRQRTYRDEIRKPKIVRVQKPQRISPNHTMLVLRSCSARRMYAAVTIIALRSTLYGHNRCCFMSVIR